MLLPIHPLRFLGLSRSSNAGIAVLPVGGREALRLGGLGVLVCVHTSKHIPNIQNIQLEPGSSVISVCLFNEQKIRPFLIDMTLHLNLCFK